ncbi:hypothetical protein [Streptomyces sp. NBC_00207]|uniref:hypothetical protein n=1 Tax=unclassified Streptomyces TaxID=2593676 RepID=UPI002888311F|nr:hypothetical protein [Streptomyces sp. DSM 41633]
MTTDSESGTAAQLARDADTDLQLLNRTVADHGYAYTGDVYDVLGALASLGSKLVQATEEAAAALVRMEARGAVGVSSEETATPREVVTVAARSLAHATVAAEQLRTRLAEAQSTIRNLTTETAQ